MKLLDTTAFFIPNSLKTFHSHYSGVWFYLLYNDRWKYPNILNESDEKIKSAVIIEKQLNWEKNICTLRVSIAKCFHICGLLLYFSGIRCTSINVTHGQAGESKCLMFNAFGSINKSLSFVDKWLKRFCSMLGFQNTAPKKTSTTTAHNTFHTTSRKNRIADEILQFAEEHVSLLCLCTNIHTKNQQSQRKTSIFHIQCCHSVVNLINSWALSLVSFVFVVTAIYATWPDMFMASSKCARGIGKFNKQKWGVFFSLFILDNAKSMIR